MCDFTLVKGGHVTALHLASGYTTLLNVCALAIVEKNTIIKTNATRIGFIQAANVKRVFGASREQTDKICSSRNPRRFQ
jgi:hypothetical protein